MNFRPMSLMGCLSSVCAVAEEAPIHSLAMTFRDACVAAKSQFFYKTRPLDATNALSIASPTCADPKNATIKPCLHKLSRAPVGNRCTLSATPAVPLPAPACT